MFLLIILIKINFKTQYYLLKIKIFIKIYNQNIAELMFGILVKILKYFSNIGSAIF